MTGSRLTVAVVTYRRPDRLAALLPALLDAAGELDAGVDVDVLVVDNDPAASARAAVAQHSGSHVRYVLELTPGIAAARNRALAEAADSDWLVFIDDDELPTPGWLPALLDAQRRSAATAVAGPVRSDFGSATHPWVAEGEALSRRHRAATRTGAPVSSAATNNLLLDLRAIRGLGVSFDPSFDTTGGEDTMFTRMIWRRGGSIVWCREAVVVDHVAPERVRTGWLLARAVAHGNAEARVAVRLAHGRRKRLLARLRAALRGALRVAGGSARWVVGTVRRSVRDRARGALTAARGVGLLLAVIGHTSRPYRARATPASGTGPAVRDGSGAQRRRALVAGYACGPGDESEAAAGWALARAAATSYDVWLITRPRFAPAITAALAAEPELAAHLVPIYLDLSAAVLRFKRRPRDVYWYYVLWQWALGRRARDLHAHIRFDVAHHATFAADWLPCGLTRLRGVPLVWGPVGGASYLRWSLAPWLGPRGVLSELARSIGTRVARAVWGDRAARRAAVVVAQNGDVAARFATHARQVVVEPNAALEPAEPRRSRDGHGEYREAVFVGRLVPWKGCRLALDALARPEAAGWRLDVYGAGPDAAALSARTRRLGLAERVSFHGWRPRAEVLDAFTRADALLFPSMHDSAGWAVAEASAVGCPVVCLDIGGPPLLAGPNGHVAAPSRDVVRALARALETAGTAARIGYPRWSAQRLPALVQDWYRDAIASTTDGGA